MVNVISQNVKTVLKHIKFKSQNFDDNAIGNINLKSPRFRY